MPPIPEGTICWEEIIFIPCLCMAFWEHLVGHWVIQDAGLIDLCSYPVISLLKFTCYIIKH